MIAEKSKPVYSRLMPGTPIGPLTIFAGTDGLVEIDFAGLPEVAAEDEQVVAILDAAVQQLGEYFAGRRQIFDLPIDWSGLTPYQERVLRACYDIPFGQVLTYAELAAQTGNPRAARAVGGFMAGNPIPLVIPCHRVVGSDRRLHGYGAPGGLDSKAFLLTLEGRQMVALKLV
jgi:methylated-DNA-[protein]-cysteine S-methyltransferase